jgi:hypothetical protein
MATPESETKVTTLAALKAPAAPEMQLPEVSAGFNSLRSFELLQRAAKALSAASLIPDNYRGNLPNCIIALEIAQRIGASPLLIMQNLYIVYGRPAWSAKFLIACFNQCGRFSSVRYIWSGTRGKDDWGCQAWSIEKSTGEKIFGPTITLELAKAEGWYGRKDSKWKTMPEKMFMYRSAAWMIDTHAPELSMGIRPEDEVRDTFDAERGADGSYMVTTESLRAAEQQLEVTTGSNAPAIGTDLGGKLPPDPKADMAAIRATGSRKELETAYEPIVMAYVNLNLPVPKEVESAYADWAAHLESKES